MKKTLQLTEGNILSSLIRFSVPVILAMFLQAMYSAVDLMVIGHFASTADVSGVSTGGTILNVVTHTTTGLAMGVTVLVGNKIGEKKPEDASRVIGAGICLFAVFAVAVTMLLTLCAGPISIVMKAPEEAYAQTTQYIRVCGFGSIFIVAYNLIGSIFRGLGDSKTPLITVTIACIFNIFADLLFVAVFDMGAMGAALATVIAQAISVFALLFIIKKRPLAITLNKKDIRFDGEYIKHELKIGFPIALQEFLVGFTLLIIQSFVNALNVYASAGFGIGEKVCVFIMLIPMSFMQSIAAFVAQNIGAGKPKRATSALGWGIVLSAAIGIITGALSFFCGDALASIFNNDPDVIYNAHQYLKAYGIDCLLTPIVFCFLGYYNGHGKTMFVMLQSIFTGFLVKVPVAYFISKIPGVGLFEIGLAIPASSFVQIILCLGMFFVMRKKDKQIEIA